MADMCDEVSLQKLKVAQLKKLLEEKGLPSGGNKPELVNRLLNFNAKGLLEDDLVDKDIPEDDSLLEDSLLVTDNSINVSANTNDASVVSPAKTQLLASSKSEANRPSTDAAAATIAQTATQNKFETRLKRFGVVSETARKAARSERFQSAASSSQLTSNGDAIKKRAERFGLTNSEPEKVDKQAAVASNGDAIKKRAERFGLINAVPEKADNGQVSVVPGVEQLKKRAERFGQVTSSSLSKVELQDRLLKRKQRFDGGSGNTPSTTASAGVELDDQKKRRLQRFGAVST